MIISPLRAFIATPSTSMLTNSSAILNLHGRCYLRARLLDDALAGVVDHVFELVTVVLQEALHGPRRRIAQRADRMALDAIGDIKKERELLTARVAGKHAPQQAIHPPRALAAGRALSAGLGHVEARDAPEDAHHAGCLIHHNDCSGA